MMNYAIYFKMTLYLPQLLTTVDDILLTFVTFLKFMFHRTVINSTYTKCEFTSIIKLHLLLHSYTTYVKS